MGALCQEKLLDFYFLLDLMWVPTNVRATQTYLM